MVSTRTADEAKHASRDGNTAFVVSLVGVGTALALFDLFSGWPPLYRFGHKNIWSERPPVYGKWEPGFTRWGLAAIVGIAVIAAVAWVAGRSRADRPRWVLAAAFAIVISFAAAVAAIGGDHLAYADAIVRVKQRLDYQYDVADVQRLGIRGFIEKHPDLLRAGKLESVHSRTHPPGPVVLLALLTSWFPNSRVTRAFLIALMSSLVVVAAWLIASRVSREPRAPPYAALFMAVAAAPAVFIFFSMDSLYAALLGLSGALVVWGLGRDGYPRIAAGAGAAVAFASFFTYAAFFIGGMAGIFVLTQLPLRQAIRRLAWTAAGALAMLVFLRVALGYDVIASFAASYEHVPVVHRSYWYWLIGNVAVWLTFAGLPVAALSVKELVFERPAYLIALFVPLILANLTDIFPGETERIGQFAYPFIAAAAGVAFARWERQSGGRRPMVLALLVAIAAAQAVALESLFNTIW